MTLAAARPITVVAAERLDELYRSFDHVTSATDPVHIVRRYESAADREVVGFCAAALAFGRVASVLQSIESLLAVMGPAAGTVRSPLRSGARQGTARATRPSMDFRPRSDRAAHRAPADAR